MIFFTVFTSSFESKSGNAMENCAKAIARVAFGAQAVPPIIRGLGANQEGVDGHPQPGKNKQIILTREKISNVTRHCTKFCPLPERC